MRDLVKFAGKICRMPVGEMAAVREIHRQDFVARFHHGEIDRHVRLRAAVRLHVHVLRAEKPLRAIDRELLGHIDIFAAAIPALSADNLRRICSSARCLALPSPRGW